MLTPFPRAELKSKYNMDSSAAPPVGSDFGSAVAGLIGQRIGAPGSGGGGGGADRGAADGAAAAQPTGSADGKPTTSSSSSRGHRGDTEGQGDSSHGGTPAQWQPSVPDASSVQVARSRPGTADGSWSSSTVGGSGPSSSNPNTDRPQGLAQAAAASPGARGEEGRGSGTKRSSSSRHSGSPAAADAYNDTSSSGASHSRALAVAEAPAASGMDFRMLMPSVDQLEQDLKDLSVLGPPSSGEAASVRAAALAVVAEASEAMDPSVRRKPTVEVLNRTWEGMNRLLAEHGFSTVDVMPLQDVVGLGVAGDVLRFMDSVYGSISAVMQQLNQRNRLAEGLLTSAEAARSRQVCV